MNRDHIKSAGSLGGRRRIELHGNPGTVEGRRLGGLRSIDTHKKSKTAFKTLRKINFPRPSARLAELLGIIMGDGHVGLYQTSVVTNSETDIEHARYIQLLMGSLFNIPVSFSERRDKKACTVLISSKEVCRFLEQNGIPRGNKLAGTMQVPTWIQKNNLYKTAFLRGLMDTDGTVYLDKHVIKGKQYVSTCIAFTNASKTLLCFVKQTLREEGYNPTVWGRHVRLRRRKEVLRYAAEIGFSNPKHSRKITV